MVIARTTSLKISGQLGQPAEYVERIELEKECANETTVDEVEHLFNTVLGTVQNDEVSLQAVLVPKRSTRCSL